MADSVPDPCQDTDMDFVVPLATSHKSLPAEIFEVLEVLADFSDFFPHPTDSEALSVSLDWCTPKVRVVVDVLLTEKSRSPSFQGIIFVEQRQVAACLARVLPCIPELKGQGITCAYLVGSGTGSDGLSGFKGIMGGRPAKDAVKLFREGAVNLRESVSAAFDAGELKT